jgi:hypothetical protein
VIKNRILSIILVAIFVASGAITLFPQPAHAIVGWYDLAWQSRKAITVTNASASYQSKILIGESSGATGEDVDCGGLCRKNFEDLRFTGADGTTALPFWVESITGTTPNQLATIWVKNDATPSTTLYMYYNNPNIVPYDFTIGGWQKYASNPVLERGAAGQWDDYWVAFTSFVKVGNTWYGYYNGCKIAALSTQVGLATSTDGITWTKSASNPVLAGGTNVNDFDYHNAGFGIVWVEGTTFYMLYGTESATTGVWGVGLATSTNGISWTKSLNNPVYVPSGSAWDANFMLTGAILKDSGTYYLYYSGNTVLSLTANGAIGVATSTDLQHFTASPSNPIIVGGNATEWDTCTLSPCAAVKFDGTYYLWYEGAPSDGGLFNRSLVGLASSSSPTSGWTKNASNPVLAFADRPGSWDKDWSEAGVIVNWGDEWRMYYTGNNMSAYAVEAGYATYRAKGDFNAVFGSGKADNFDWKWNGHNVAINTAGGNISWTRATGTGTTISADQSYDGGIGDSRYSVKLAGAAAVNQDIYFTLASGDNTYAINGRFYKETADTQFILAEQGNGTNLLLPYIDVNENVMYSDGVARDTGVDVTADAWHTFEVNNINFTAGTYDIYIDGVLAKDDAAMMVNAGANQQMHILNADQTADHDCWADNYFVRKWATTEPSLTFGSAETSPSAVTTGEASGVSVSGATLNGSLDNIGSYLSMLCYFQYGLTPWYDTATTAQTLTAVGAFTQAITGLSPNTLYYYRAVARNGTSYIYGIQRIFYTTSSGGTPMVSTGSATSVTSSSATLAGSLDSLGGFTPVYVSLQYGTSTNYSSSTVEESKTSTVGFSASVTALQPNTTYYYRARVRYGAGVYAYGSGQSFTTSSAGTAPIMYEALSTGQDGNSDAIHGANWADMQFTVGATSHTATSIHLYLKRLGSPGTVTVSLRNAAAGLPTGADLISTTFDGNLLTTGYDWYSYNISETTLTATLQYAIVVRATAGDVNNCVYWGIDAGGGLANAVYGKSVNSGVTFATDAPKDALFEIWSSPISQGLQVIGAKVFTGYMTTGDWLIVADVNNTYPPYYPDNDPQAYFQLQVISGTTIKASTPFKAWERQPLAIYLSPATAGTLTWGSGYVIRIQCLTTTSVMEQYTLMPSDWYGGGIFWLDSHIRSLASTYQTYYTATYLVATADKGNVLNAAGGVIFDTGIPNLSIQRPGLFETTYHPVTTTAGTFTHAGQSAIVWSDRVGTQVTDKLTDAGDLAGGMDGKEVLGFIILICWLICSISIATGHYAGGAIAGLPLIAIGLFFGGIGLEMILAIGGIAVVVIGRAIFLNNQG